MIRLGACSLPENAALLGGMGFEYIEIGLAWLHGLSDEEYAAQLEIVKNSPIPVEAANGMLPGSVKVTGPDVSEEAINDYLAKAFARAHEMGVKVIVFGSGAARGVPEGFPFAEAWRQIARFLAVVDTYCERYGIELAIEPLRRGECNIINLVTEGAMMSALVDLPHIGTLGDTYHMVCSHEPYSAFSIAGKLLKHVHIGHTLGVDQGRVWPTEDDGEDYKEIFDALKAAGYEGRVSIEAGFKDLAVDGPRAYSVLSAARG